MSKVMDCLTCGYLGDEILKKDGTLKKGLENKRMCMCKPSASWEVPKAVRGMRWKPPLVDLKEPYKYCDFWAPKTH